MDISYLQSYAYADSLMLCIDASADANLFVMQTSVYKNLQVTMFFLQDLEQQIVDLQSSADDCYERSSQLMIMLSQMSDFNPTKYCLADADEHPNSKDKLLSQCLQKFQPSSEVQICDEHPKVDITPNSEKKETRLQQLLAASSFSNKFLPMASAAKDEENENSASILHSTFDKVGVPNGPSQRAASLLLSRSPSNYPLPPPQHFCGIRQPVSVKTQHLDGAELCDDPYATICSHNLLNFLRIVIASHRFPVDGIKYIPSEHAKFATDSINSMLERAPSFFKKQTINRSDRPQSAGNSSIM